MTNALALIQSRLPKQQETGVERKGFDIDLSSFYHYFQSKWNKDINQINKWKMGTFWGNCQLICKELEQRGNS
jgi:hypothetical protein